VLAGLLLALGFVGVWKFMTWQLENRRSTIRWSKVRFWWPTTMLLWGWGMLAMFTKSESWGWLFDALAFLFGLLNFPAMVPVVVVVGILRDSFQLPPLAIVLGSTTMWAGNYLIVRLAEWRAWSNAPIALHLVDGDTGPGKSA
jgi:hypothetical protein